MISSWIAGLMRTDYPALGFIPETTIKQRYITQNRYILQLDEEGQRVGYLLHGAIHYGQSVVISQAMIDYDKRLKGYGVQAVNELVRRSEIGGASSIKLRCAADLPAVNFWQSAGFQITGIIPGGKKRNRLIIQFVHPLSLPLFPLGDLLMANDNITPFQLKWEEKFIAATEKHIDLFRKAGAALNDHLNHSQFGSISQRELNLHDHSKFSEAELPHYARRFFGPNDDPAGWQRALAHHYQSNPHHWQCWLDGFEKPGDEAQCTAREMPAEQCLILVTDWLATGKQITGSWVLTGWLINNLCGHEPKIILHQETRLAIDNILAAIGYWTNFDNVPLYCLTNNEFIGMLEGY